MLLLPYYLHSWWRPVICYSLQSKFSSSQINSSYSMRCDQSWCLSTRVKKRVVIRFTRDLIYSDRLLLSPPMSYLVTYTAYCNGFRASSQWNPLPDGFVNLTWHRLQVSLSSLRRVPSMHSMNTCLPYLMQVCTSLFWFPSKRGTQQQQKKARKDLPPNQYTPRAMSVYYEAIMTLLILLLHCFLSTSLQSFNLSKCPFVGLFLTPC